MTAEAKQNYLNSSHDELRNVVPFRESLAPVELCDRFGNIVIVPVVLDHTLRRVTSSLVAKNAAGKVQAVTRDIMARGKELRGKAVEKLRETLPVYAWTTLCKSSWQVMEAICTNSDALSPNAIRTDGFGDTDRKGSPLKDWLVYNDRGDSLRDVRLGDEVAIFDTWDVAKGVAERARGFEDFYTDAIRTKIEERLAFGSRDPILMIDFASGSGRYAIQALHVLLMKDPALKRAISGDPSVEGKILLKFIGVDQDRGAKRYSDALAQQLGVGEYVDNVTHRVTEVEGLFDGIHHSLLLPDTRVDVMTSSGLIDYFNGHTNRTLVSKASFVVEMRERLKVGGLYCNANIVKLSPNEGTDYTEQDVLKTLFRWLPMYEVTPQEFAQVHLQGVNRGGWHPDELQQITALPSCGKSLDTLNRSFVLMTGQRRHEHRYYAFSQTGTDIRRLNTDE